ncbi:MAG TPA: hypothetical protein VK148_28100 [Xanthobacteraceae bacterium]|jgi:hypothetical protein|nr:hypothetical protein [Xanthobacteraceae bacterium]
MNERAPEAVKKIIPFAKDPYVPAPKSAFAPQPKAAAAPPPKDIPYAPARDVRPDGDTVERSGQAIVALLQQAADSANSNCDRAMEYAHKISVQLRASDERIKELEGDLRHFQDRAERAEERAQRAESWLVRIYKDVEQRFFEQKAAPPQQSQR